MTNDLERRMFEHGKKKLDLDRKANPNFEDLSADRLNEE
jgi:hypothetical protein